MFFSFFHGTQKELFSIRARDRLGVSQYTGIDDESDIKKKKEVNKPHNNIINNHDTF